MSKNNFADSAEARLNGKSAKKQTKKGKSFKDRATAWITDVALPYLCATLVVLAAVDDGVRRIREIKQLPDFLQGAIALFITVIVLQNAVKVVKKK